MAFAQDTTVPVDRSRAEIERVLQRYGARRFASMWDDKGAAIAFEASGKMIRFVLPLPDRGAFQHFTDAYHRARTRKPEAAARLWEQACRSRWRALNLVIKAKLEAVETGITTFEDEFLAHVVLPSGETFGQWARPKLEAALKGRPLPLLLPVRTATDEED